MKPTITFLFFLFITCANCQVNTNYEVLNRVDSGNIKTNKPLKKYTKPEQYNLRFSKSVASTLSRDFFEKVEKISYTHESASFKKKDTINYVVYDYLLKKDVNINELKSNINLGIKSISGYKAPTTCITFLNQDKITCACRFSLEESFLKDEDFVNSIKENTEKRLKSTKAK